MNKRSVSKLHFVGGRDPLPTIEIQAESLEGQGFYLGQIVSSALAHFAERNPTSKATVYTYGTMSVNFIEHGWSEFLIVAGDKKVLTVLHSAFSVLPKVNFRYSDYIAPNAGTIAFHVEDGRLWEPEDAITWYSTSLEDEGDERISVDKTTASVEGSEDDDNIWDNVVEDSELEVGDNESDVPTAGRIPEKPGRYRAARSDAKVSGVRQTIEQLFGLPEGSVALCGPDGRALKGNALIRTLRRRWEDA